MLPGAKSGLTQFDVDLVCGEDHGRVLVGGGRWREPGVGRRRISGVADGFDGVQLAASLHFVAEPVDEHTRPRCFVQRGAEKGRWCEQSTHTRESADALS